MNNQLREAEGQFLPQEVIRERLEREGIAVKDCSGYLRSNSKNPSELYLFGDGIHFSAFGHRRIAEFMKAAAL